MAKGGFLKALGQGLQIASLGAPSTFQAYVGDQRQQQRQQFLSDQKKKEMYVGLATEAFKNGQMTKEQFDQVMEWAGMKGAPTPGISLERQKYERELATKQASLQERAYVADQLSGIESRVAEAKRQSLMPPVPVDQQPTAGGLPPDATPQGEPLTAPAALPSEPTPTSLTEGDNPPEVWETYDPRQDPEYYEEVASEADRIARNVEYNDEARKDAQRAADKAREQAKILRQEQKPQIVQGKDGQMYQVWNFPEGAHFQQIKERDPSAAERKIERFKKLPGVSEEEAIKLAEGIYVVATDAQGRDYIWDKVTKRKVAGLEAAVPGVRTEQQGSRSSFDPAAATGGSGFFGRAINTVVGLFGGGLVFQEAEKATDALEQMRIDTISVAQAKIPGRPSNWTLQLADTLAVNPRWIFTGDARAVQKFKSTRRYLQKEYDRMKNTVLANPGQYSIEEINDTTHNATQLEQIIAEYDWLIKQSEAKGKPRPSMEEIWGQE
jgi:hypothetical protein